MALWIYGGDIHVVLSLHRMDKTSHFSVWLIDKSE
jgi:hypothetical protein